VTFYISALEIRLLSYLLSLLASRVQSGDLINMACVHSERVVCVVTDNVPPPDSISEQITPRVISVRLLMLMSVMASLGIVLSCIFLVFNISYRHCKYVDDDDDDDDDDNESTLTSHKF